MQASQSLLLGFLQFCSEDFRCDMRKGKHAMSTAKKELFSERVRAGSRTYFFDVKEAATGAKYLVINESKKVGESHEHNRIMIFEEDILSFNEGLKKAVDFMVK